MSPVEPGAERCWLVTLLPPCLHRVVPGMDEMLEVLLDGVTEPPRRRRRGNQRRRRAQESGFV
ncbi:hypothetical protein [Streptomyces sp. NPDC001502]|uniref:hypothetical protein n=1 Tax=Streptomyces sp. NPDC001502 TaxID=3364578 RepID=UPI00369955B7